MAKTKAKGADPAKKPEIEVVLHHRRTGHDYEIIKTYEAGLVLTGSEVKSLRNHDLQWGDAHGRFDRNGELWLYGLHIAEYKQAAHMNHLPAARRKLLLHRRELDYLRTAMEAKGCALVPTQIHFRRGYAKLVLAIGKRRKKGDKREALRDRDQKRDVARELARRERGR